MSGRERCRALVAGGLVFAILLAIGLAVMPQLHERLHADAAQSAHECAVTLIAAGKCEQAGAPIQLTAPPSAVQFAKIPAFHPLLLPTPFLNAAIFEHAPPSFA